MARGVEDPIDLELEGVSGLEGSEGGEEPGAAASKRCGEVGGASVEGKVFAPGAALAERFFGKEEFRRGGKVVECLGRKVKILIGVVETGSR
jgi:hypothetical protein